MRAGRGIESRVISLRARRPDSEEYEQAMMRFYERHLCRIPFPDVLQRTFAQLAEDARVYRTMNGPSEFH
jgi:L-proline amide hydrolase